MSLPLSVALRAFCASVLLTGCVPGSLAWADEHLPAGKANAWYDEQPWLVNCNYAPASGS